MDMVLWIALFLMSTMFAGWILFGGGADWLEGSFLSGLLLFFRAPTWSADGIKIFVGITWVAELIWFVIGLFDPQVRLFF